MSYNNPNDLNAVAQNDYNVDMGRFLSRGWEIFQRNIGGFIGFFVLTFLISLVLSYIPLIGAIVNLITSGPLNAGFYFVTFLLMKGRSSEFGDFFKGFQNNAFVQILLCSLVTGLLVGLAGIPAGIALAIGFFALVGSAGSASAESIPAISAALGLPALLIGFLLLIPAIFLGLLYSFAIPIVVDRRIEFWPAMEASRKIVIKKWLPLLLFGLVLGLINFAGALACGLGLLFTAPLTLCAWAAAYEGIVGLNTQPE